MAMTSWFEVNITPAGKPEDLILHVAGPLVKLLQPSAWFFFWEDAEERDDGEDLRLRLKDISRNTAVLFLDAAQDKGEITGWYEGNHGIRGESYNGEGDFYGEAVWEATYRNWTMMSYLALQLITMDNSDQLVKSRSFHLRRNMHLYANQLKLDDITVCLRQAHTYLELRNKGTDPEAARLLAAIDRYLHGDRGDSR
jgi:hypothetical protein